MWKSRKTHLDALEQSLAHHGRIKATLEQQFDEMRRQKEQLKAEIDAVEAEYKALQLQQIESKYQTDDTRLARIKENLRSMRHKLDVAEGEAQADPEGPRGPRLDPRRRAVGGRDPGPAGRQVTIRRRTTRRGRPSAAPVGVSEAVRSIRAVRTRPTSGGRKPPECFPGQVPVRVVRKGGLS